MPFPNQLVRLLLKFYPARFREEYGNQVERQLHEDYAELTSAPARALFWFHALADLGTSIPLELFRELRQDVRYAARSYARRRFVTALAVAALALSIGAATGVFSVVNALLLRTLPFADPNRLVEVWLPPANGLHGRTAFFAWRNANRYLQDVAAYSPSDATLKSSADSTRVKLAEVSANFFSMLGAPPELGRDFRADEDAEGNTHAAILSHSLWDRAFGADPRVLGSTIYLNGVALKVLGVEPAGVEYPAGAEIWTPTAFELSTIPKSGAIGAFTAGRLRDGISLSRARQQFRADVAGRSAGRPIGEVDPPNLIPLRDQLSERIRQASLVLFSAVVCMLLIACANLAHLLLTRTSERRHELAIRAALGASEGRLLQQLLTEGLLLTGVAALAGLSIAWWAAQAAAAALPPKLATQSYTVLDARVLAFAAVAAGATALLFGVVPAIALRRLRPRLEDTRTSGAGRSAPRLRFALLAMQAVLTVVLLTGTFVMGRGFLRLMNSDLGFETSRVLALNVSLSGTSYGRTSPNNTYYRAALAALRAIPGVDSAAGTEIAPFSATFRQGGVFTDDRGSRTGPAQLVAITPGYFKTLGVALLAGRDFDDSDRYRSPAVAIVSEPVAHSLGGRSAALGRRLTMFSGTPVTIVGVAAGLREAGPSGRPQPSIYFPSGQRPPGFLTFVVRVRGRAEPYLAVCRDVLRSVDRAVPVYQVETLDTELGRNLAQPRFYTAAVSLFGGFSLLLALIAIYGSATYSIQQRRHEIGVRAAMGASPKLVRMMLLREGAAPILLGIVIGIAGGLELGRSAQVLLSVAEPPGAVLCAAAGLLLGITATLAIWISTRRVLRLDPTAVLRAD